MIVITISGGCLRDVYGAGTNAPVGYYLVDWDNIEAGDRLEAEEIAALSVRDRAEYLRIEAHAAAQEERQAERGD